MKLNKLGEYSKSIKIIEYINLIKLNRIFWKVKNIIRRRQQ